MALRFCDSFDHYTNLSKKYTSVFNSPNISSGTGRNGGASFHIIAPNGWRYVRKTLDSQQTWIIGFALKLSSLLLHANAAVCALLDAGSVQVDLRVLTDGTLRITRNGTTLGTTSFSISEGTYYYIELKVKIDPTTGTAEVRVNGDSKLALTGQNTRATSNSTADEVQLGPSSGSMNDDLDLDDLYVCDTSGSTNNDFLGDVRVEAIYPDGAGSSAQWTPSTGSNYQTVDENPPNDDTDYNSSSNPGDVDLFSFGNVTPTAGTVYGVQVLPYARKDDAGTRTIRSKAKSGSTTGSGSNNNLSTSYAYYPQVFQTNPDTSAQWTISEVNGAEFGYEEVA